MRLPHDISIALEALRGAERLVPDYLLDRVENLNPQALKNLGYSHIIFDFDNTLTHWGGNTLPPAIQRLFRSLANAGFTILVASNGRSKRFSKLAAQWESTGIFFIGRCGKPKADKIESFMRKNSWNRDTTILIGDNLGADIGAARTIGCSVALVHPKFWLEFPLTKIWRFVEWVHRRRRAKEWATVPHLSHSTVRRRTIPWKYILFPAFFIPVLLFHVPLTRTPVPGSSLSVYTTDFAESIENGWPTHSAQEPERSLLLAIVTLIGTKTLGTDWVGPFSMAMIWIASLLIYKMIQRKEGWVTAIIVTVIVLLAPATLSAIGEMSSASLELALILSLLSVTGNPVFTGVICFFLLLNGMSGIVVIPVLLLHMASMRKPIIIRAICIAALCAAAVLIFVITSGTASPVPWSADTLTLESPSFASISVGDAQTASQFVVHVEEALNIGLVERDFRLFPFPILMIVIILSILISIRSNPAISLYLILRIGTMVLLPSLFLRALPLTLFLPLFIMLIASVIRLSSTRFVPVIFAVMILLAVVSGSRDARRHIVTLRHTFYAEKSSNENSDKMLIPMQNIPEVNPH